MSARSGAPAASRSDCSANSASPHSRTVPAGIVARTTSEPSFTAVPSSGSTTVAGCGGPSTSRVRPGQDSRRPAASATSGTCAAAASLATPRSSHAGSWTGPTAIAPTGRPRKTPSSPPTWSACRWLSRTSATPCTPSLRRHPSTGAASGPVSTTTTQPGRAVASTRASPCPTSQATIIQPDGGQPGRVSRTGTTTSTTPASTASTTARRRRERHTAAPTTSVAAINSAPDAPAGHGTVAPDTAAAWSATAISHAAGHPASHTQARATGSAKGATSAASTPSTVAGATAGAASRLATTATGLTSPPNPAMSGAVTTNAAAGTASASAAQRGTLRRCSARAHGGASSTSAAVAATDRAKPASTARAGSTSRMTITDAASAGIADRPRPAPIAMRATAPITAARTTLGDGRASMTKPTSTAPATTEDRRGSLRRRRSAASAAPVSNARLAPDTATRCVNPEARKSSSTWVLSALVSPIERPGRSPASAGPTVLVAAARRPERRPPAADCHHGGAPTSCATPRTRSTAIVRSVRSGGASRPSAVTA